MELQYEYADHQSYWFQRLLGQSHCRPTQGRIWRSDSALAVQPAKAKTLAATFNCTVAANETSMLAESDWILLAVRPEQVASAGS